MMRIVNLTESGLAGASNMKRRILSLGLVMMLILPVSLQAALTGVLTGKIHDSDGNPIQGVLLTVTGENMPGSRIGTTGNSGVFRIPELPPGFYLLSAEMAGMKTIERYKVKISVNTTTRIDFTMEVAPFEETVVVMGLNPALDAKAATIKTTIERNVMERLPGSADYDTAFSLSGGITGGGDVRVHGSAKNDNLYLFDGVDTTDPVTATSGSNLNADAIEEVEVQTGGFSAEYGRSMGGIVNAVTKSGSNVFHGIVRLKYLDSDWHSDFDNEQAQETYNYWEPTVTLEGPIMKDTLWFMVSYDYYERDSTRKVIGGYGYDYYSGGDNLADLDTSQVFHLPYAKVTFQPNPSNKIVANYSGEEAVLHGMNGSWESSCPETWNKQEQGGPFYSLEWTWLYNSKLTILTRMGVSFGVLDNVPESGDRDSPSFYDMYYMQRYNNSEYWVEEDRERLQMSLTASYFLESWSGSHAFKGGIERHISSREQTNIFPGGASYIINSDPSDPYAWQDSSRTLYLNPGTAEESGDYMAYFLQDNWSVLDNLTLNIGLRYETARYENDDGNTSVPAWNWGEFRWQSYRNQDGSFIRYANMVFDDMLAPRLGINWDIRGNGKTVLHGYYGRFYNPFDLSLPGMFQPFTADTTAYRRQEYCGPKWHDANHDGIPDEDHFFERANWETSSESEPGDWNLLDPDLEAEYTDEFMVGIEQEIRENLFIGMAYTYRTTNDMIEDTGLFVDQDGNIVWTYRGGVKDDLSGLDPNRQFDPRYGKDYDTHLYYVTNAEGSTREYNGLEINASARLEHYDLQASYTFSKSEGAVTEGQPGYGAGVAQFSGQFDTYSTSLNLFGELPWSCRHYLKIAGSTHWVLKEWYEISIGVNGFYRSGYHYSKRTTPPKTFDPDDASNDIDNPDTWTGRPPYRSYAWYFPEGRGTYELPGVSQWDVSIQNSFHFGFWGAVTMIFDIFNVFDNQAISYESDVYNRSRPDTFGQASGWTTPRTWQLSFKYAF
jgi:outer membrane receptor protein involved in Fe transport